MVITAYDTKLKPGYKQTEVGVIPEDWEIHTLGDELDQLEAGVSVNSVDEEFHKYSHEQSILKTSAVSNGYFIPNENKKIAPRDIKRAKLNPRFDSIIISRMNTPDLVGECGYVEKDYKNLFLPDRLWMTRFNRESKVNVKWLSYLLSFKEYKLKIKSAATGTSGSMKNISKNSLLSITIPFPSPKEQMAIATALSDIDALITSLDRLITKKRDIKQATMQQLLRGKTRLPGFSGEWEVRKLKNECELITKGTTPTSLGKNFSTHGVNFIKIESLTDEGHIIKDKLAFIDEETHNLLRRSQLKNMDILFSIAGALGRTALVKQDILPANTNQALALIRLRNRSCLDHIFLTIYLTGPEIIRHIGSINVQAAQANLSLEDIRNFEIRIPAIPEQRAIATILSDMDAEIAALVQKRDKIRYLKQGMMQELLSGKTRLV